MFKKRLYTFIVANHAGGKVRRLSLPYSILTLGGIFALVGVLAVGAAALQYGKLLIKVVDYQHRISENDALRSENHEYKVQTAQLGEKVDFLETLSHKLMVFSGMNSDKSVGGVGGVSKDTLSKPRPISAGALQAIASYDKKASSLEERLRDLDNQISDQVLYEAASPNILPVKGYITEGYGSRPDPFDPAARETHLGVDISAPMGSRVVASADGVVIFSGQRAGYGNMIVIDHKFGWTTRYAHLQRINVQVGQRVSRNEIIGSVGVSGRSTGPHLHYEMWHFNQPVNPLKYAQSLKSGLRDASSSGRGMKPLLP
jgi:murein DD-endopeptidase MepM/ murein hydrolase activator NlpD